MTPLPINLTPEADWEDLEEAYQWYEGQQSGLGTRFVEQVERTFDRIRAMPSAGAPANGSGRLVLVKRFPYVVCYLTGGHAITVVAVFQGHSDPQSWRDRLHPE